MARVWRTRTLAALLLLPAVSAGHGFYVNDPGAIPGPADVSYLEWETDGETTRIDLSGNLGDAQRHVVVLAGKPGGALQRHVQTAADGNGSAAPHEGVDGEEQVEWMHGSQLTVHWNPALAPKTCVLVVAWVGGVEDVAPDADVDSLDDADALWDEGRACSHRSRLNYAAQCGHPDIPAYCSPAPALPAALLLLVSMVFLRGRPRN